MPKKEHGGTGLEREMGTMRIVSPQGLGAPAPEDLPPTLECPKTHSSFFRAQNSTVSGFLSISFSTGAFQFDKFLLSIPTRKTLSLLCGETEGK